MSEIPEMADSYRPDKYSLSNSEVRATGILCGGAVFNIAQELLSLRADVAALEAENGRLREALAIMVRKCSVFHARPDLDPEIIAARAILAQQPTPCHVCGTVGGNHSSFCSVGYTQQPSPAQCRKRDEDE